MRLICSLCFVACASLCIADGPADNKADSVRPIPPLGIEIADDARTELVAKLASLDAKIAELRTNAKSPQYLPDVEVFSKAVSIALNENGFYEERDIKSAHEVLDEGLKRAELLAINQTPWATIAEKIGDFVTVRGFRSKIDGSIQPYGIVYVHGTAEDTSDHRADVWCRGRMEKGLELQFVAQRLKSTDPKPAQGVLMIHPFGRYCNANKLAGEVDTLEALEHASRDYPIDPKRISIRGFSMGGAAAWHLAVHYPDRWFAANPGAGFCETPKFLNVFQSETLQPSDFEQTLWRLYDCPGWAMNLKNLPTIAYSGEIDKQKQAADLMAEACWNDHQFELTHIIGPKTAHKIELNAAAEIERRLRLIESKVTDDLPKVISFTTYTLKYNKCNWITVDALDQHWEPGTIEAKLTINQAGTPFVWISTNGVTQFTIEFDPGQFSASTTLHVQIAGAIQDEIINARSDGSWKVRFRKEQSDKASRWKVASPIEATTQLVKKHDLQGPIDDAFMSSFVFVKPNGAGINEAIDRWVDAEMNRAVKEWHRQMRGDIRVITPDELTPDIIASNNIVLWGDASSNPKIAVLLPSLPMTWNSSEITIGKQRVDAGNHVPALIYPNPNNPDRYIVLNSGLTYREYDYLNNARQVPKLPDWALIDISTEPTSRSPGKITAAGFFDEKWLPQSAK
jgi:hypothetical protein